MIFFFCFGFALFAQGAGTILHGVVESCDPMKTVVDVALTTRLPSLGSNASKHSSASSQHKTVLSFPIDQVTPSSGFPPIDAFLTQLSNNSEDGDSFSGDVVALLINLLEFGKKKKSFFTTCTSKDFLFKIKKIKIKRLPSISMCRSHFIFSNPEYGSQHFYDVLRQDQANISISICKDRFGSAEIQQTVKSF